MDITNNSENQFLYKYVPFNQYSLQILINQRFWLAPPDILNDPFEGDFIIENIEELQNEEFIKDFIGSIFYEEFEEHFLNNTIQEILNNKQKLQNLIYSQLNTQIREEYGTTSFSSNCDSLKMWSHYADSHKGFVIVFNKDLIEKAIIINYAKLEDVKYNGLPRVKILEGRIKERIKNIKDILINKLPEWSTEEEIRIIKKIKGNSFDARHIKFYPNSIVGILFGHRMSDIEIITILNILKKQYENEILYYFTKKNDKRDGLYFEQRIPKR